MKDAQYELALKQVRGLAQIFIEQTFLGYRIDNIVDPADAYRTYLILMPR